MSASGSGSLPEKPRAWALIAVAGVVLAFACAFCFVAETLWILHPNTAGAAAESSPAWKVSRICALVGTALSMGTAAFAIRVVTRPPDSSEPADLVAPMEVPRISGQFLTVQEEERKSLSRDLHDGIGQILTALKMELARLKVADAGDAERLERARAMADEMLASIRNLSRLLRPTALDDLGLEAALRWHVDEFTRRTSIPCDLNCALPEDEFLSEPLKTCVYRVVQEALNNSEKHASAQKVSVGVKQDADSIRVRIADDGVGFRDSVAKVRGLGLIGMWERAAMLGGNVEIESAPGKGAVVILTLPMSRRT